MSTAFWMEPTSSMLTYSDLVCAHELCLNLTVQLHEWGTYLTTTQSFLKEVIFNPELLLFELCFVFQFYICTICTCFCLELYKILKSTHLAVFLYGVCPSWCHCSMPKLLSFVELSRQQSTTVEFLFYCSDCSRFLQTVADSHRPTHATKLDSCVASTSAVRIRRNKGYQCTEGIIINWLVRPKCLVLYK